MKNFDVEKFINQLHEDTHLAFLFVAAERRLYEDDKEHLTERCDRLARESENFSESKKREELLKIARFEQNNMFLKIILLESSELGTHGFTTVHDRGALIRCPKNDDHLKQHIIIAHEIGHLLLHTERNPDDGSRFLRQITKDEKEKEATEFAKQILLSRSEYMKNANCADNEICYTAEQIDEAIKSIPDINKAPEPIYGLI
ncbi:MAG: ImmA/IrrE family metallo-endopeptidase [Clostridia bacterium]|nr:ImmA/IrrE family metallo-endopeptidase [Clostridia bacterium]